MRERQRDNYLQRWSRDPFFHIKVALLRQSTKARTVSTLLGVKKEVDCILGAMI